MKRLALLILLALGASAAAQQAPSYLIGASQPAAVTTTAAQIVVARVRQSVAIEQLGTTPVYIGPAGVTAATGFPIQGVVGTTVTISTSGPVYAVTATGTSTVAVLESF